MARCNSYASPPPWHEVAEPFSLQQCGQRQGHFLEPPDRLQEQVGQRHLLAPGGVVDELEQVAAGQDGVDGHRAQVGRARITNGTGEYLGDGETGPREQR
ncbi:MAG: hypothetical protein HY332_25585 [Chloroflexi bacterium]|nr:hypothetical protein [Chloroflexota bacterium]